MISFYVIYQCACWLWPICSIHVSEKARQVFRLRNWPVNWNTPDWSHRNHENYIPGGKRILKLELAGKNTTGKVELLLRCKEMQPIGRQRVHVLLFNRFSYYRKKLINCTNSKLNLVIGFLPQFPQRKVTAQSLLVQRMDDKQQFSFSPKIIPRL